MEVEFINSIQILDTVSQQPQENQIKKISTFSNIKKKIIPNTEIKDIEPQKESSLNNLIYLETLGKGSYGCVQKALLVYKNLFVALKSMKFDANDFYSI